MRKDAARGKWPRSWSRMAKPWLSTSHSVRGAIAGLLRKRLGLTVVLTRNADRERVYRIG